MLGGAEPAGRVAVAQWRRAAHVRAWSGVGGAMVGVREMRRGWEVGDGVELDEGGIK